MVEKSTTDLPDIPSLPTRPPEPEPPPALAEGAADAAPGAAVNDETVAADSGAAFVPIVSEGRPKRKRRTKEEIAADRAAAEAADALPELTPEEFDDYAQAFGFCFSIVMGIIARRLGPHWETSPEERKRFGEDWTGALEPWLPRAGAFVKIGKAIASTGDMLQPRIVRSLMERREREQAPKDATASERAGGEAA